MSFRGKKAKMYVVSSEVLRDCMYESRNNSWPVRQDESEIKYVFNLVAHGMALFAKTNAEMTEKNLSFYFSTIYRRMFFNDLSTDAAVQFIE